MPNISQPYVAGPCQIFVGTGGQGPPQVLEFLGWCENEVRPSFNGMFSDVMCDISGGMVAYDKQFMGENAQVVMDLKKFNQAVLTKLQSRLATGTAGVGAAGSIGTLMILEKMAVRLLIYCPYPNTKSAYSTGVHAINFPNAWVGGAIEIPLSTRANAVRLVFECLPTFANDGSYTLYNSDTSGIVSTN